MANKRFDFAYPDLGTATTYAGELALPYLGAATASNSIEDGLLTRIDGVRNKAVVSSLVSSDPVVASLCATTDGNNLDLNEKVLTATDVMVNEALCRKTLYPTWVAHQMKNRNGEPSDFIDFAMSYVAQRAAEQVENFIYKGSSVMGVGLIGEDGTALTSAHIKASRICLKATSGAPANYVKTNGGSANTSSNIDDALLAVYNKAVEISPGILTKPDVEFIMGPADYAKYLVFLGTQGSGFNAQVTSQDFGQVSFLGIPVKRAMGMPENAIILTYASNLFVGTNLGSDMAEAQVVPRYKYDGSDFIQLIMRFGIGVQVGIQNDAILGADVTVS